MDEFFPLHSGRGGRCSKKSELLWRTLPLVSTSVAFCGFLLLFHQDNSNLAGTLNSVSTAPQRLRSLTGQQEGRQVAAPPLRNEHSIPKAGAVRRTLEGSWQPSSQSWMGLEVVIPSILSAVALAGAIFLSRSSKQPQEPGFAIMASSGIAYQPPAFGRTVLLDKVNTPKDMKSFTIEQLKQLADELRYELLCAVSKKGGHLGSSLGVIELTVALHYVFNTPEDPIVWDVSHQCYPHKILTGRRNRMNTLRDRDGISGFTKRSESEYDVFGAGHSSTSISAALGMAIGRDRLNKPSHCVAVIGDGAITGGMAYEAMNCAAYLDSRLIVILNDNGEVSLPTGTPSAGGVGPVGSLSKYTNKLINSAPAFDIREMGRRLNELLPGRAQEFNMAIDKYTRGLISGGTLFEELGFFYIGPVDGHDLDQLVPILQRLYTHREKPVMLHVKTVKGYGYPPALAASDKYHAVPKFDVLTGRKVKQPATVTYTSMFADALIGLGQDDRSVVAITAAMPGGTGVDKFGERFPSRTFDVGIAEQHAVTFAAGLAIEGLKPFCCIYSTFLQRGYDQVVHDVALQKLPVRFIMDRAGLVGHDGPTHHGSFDLTFLGCIPDIIIMAPSNELELIDMVTTAHAINDMPTAVRYPRGSVYGLARLNDLFGYNLAAMPVRGKVLPVGKGWVVRRAAEGAKHTVALLSIGTRLSSAVQAARTLEATGNDIGVTVADARFMKPLDKDLIKELALSHDVIITIEENSIGGFGDHVLHYLHNEGLMDSGKLKARSMTLADEWYEAATWNEQIKDAGLVPADIHRLALEVLRLPPSPVVGSAPQGAASLAATVKVDVVGQLERSDTPRVEVTLAEKVHAATLEGIANL